MMNEFLSSTTTIMPEQVFVNSNLKRRAATKKINVAKRERNVMRTRALKTPSKRKSSVDEFMSFVFSSVTDPRFLVPFILAFSLLYAYKSSKDTSPIGVFIDNLKNNSNTAGVGSFLETNIKVLLGTIAFAPGLCVMPEAKRITMLDGHSVRLHDSHEDVLYVHHRRRVVRIIFQDISRVVQILCHCFGHRVICNTVFRLYPFSG